MTSKTVNIPGINCDNCVRTIQQEVGALEGVHSVLAQAKAKIAIIEWDESVISWNAIHNLLHEIHFPPQE